jgi:hypothetical protein
MPIDRLSRSGWIDRTSLALRAIGSRSSAPLGKKRTAGAPRFPFGISSLGPWLGSKEGEVANMTPHYRAMLEDTGFVVVRRRAVEFNTEG